MNPEIPGHSHHGNLCGLQAKGATTFLTVEMGMHVVNGSVILSAMAVGAAHGILEHARAVIDGMDEMMREEQSDGAVDG